MRFIPTLLCDFYKVSHKDQYPKGTEKIYSTWIPRTSRIDGVKKVVAFGFQGFAKEYLIDYFNESFFNQDVELVCNEYERYIKFTLGVKNPNSTHIRELHELGYLPIKILAVPEGTKVPLRVPMLTIENTSPKFFWVTNYLETLMSAQLWFPATSATIANEYRIMLEKWALKTVGNIAHVPFQGHDFSMRGMTSLQSATISGAGHLLSFVGTDTIPAIMYHEAYYNADIENELVGTSIPATEHSVQCTFEDDKLYFKTMITEVYPSGFASIVSDGYDYWKMLSDVVPSLKDVIMNRDGKVVIRPDSGDPVKIICGDIDIYDLDKDELFIERHNTLDGAILWATENLGESVRNKTPHGECGESNPSQVFKFNDEYYKLKLEIFWNRYDKQYYFIDEVSVESCEKIELHPTEIGSVEVLWNIFGGTINELGYKELDPHIGIIYGDAITLDRANEICKRLESKGFASSNIVFGIGSYTYQYNTRDTFGFALKATYAMVNGKEVLIFKDPKTDDGTKKSLKGLVAVIKSENGDLISVDNMRQKDLDELSNDIMRPIFENGKLLIDDSLEEIRKRIRM